MSYDISKYKYRFRWFLQSEIYKHLSKHIVFTDKHNILEIGSFEGLSACFFSDMLLSHADSSLVCVDPFIPSGTIKEITSKHITNQTLEYFKYNIKQSSGYHKIKFYQLKSDDFFKINTDKYDFIYIDGCHEQDFIHRDMVNGFKVLKNGGIMWMDDYLGGSKEKPCRKPMDSFIKAYSDKCRIIHKNYQLALVKLKD